MILVDVDWRTFAACGPANADWFWLDRRHRGPDAVIDRAQVEALWDVLGVWLDRQKPENEEGRIMRHPESYCHRCGGPNMPWAAPSPLWNAVMRGGSINGPEQCDGVVCPTCFAALAEDQGVADLWRLSAERVRVELEIVTPSGRIWDSEAWLWREPGEDVPASRVEHLEREVTFWREQRDLAANVAAGIADLDEEAPALRQMLRTERQRREAEEGTSLAAEVERDKLRAEVAALRQQLDEARGGLRAAAENVLARRAELDAAEADNARLLDVYRAAEAWRDWWATLRPEGGMFAPENGLAAAVDRARRAGTPAEAAPPSVPADDDRHPGCVERWPECFVGGYDPRCCRFPKSCSCWSGDVPAEAPDGERA